MGIFLDILHILANILNPLFDKISPMLISYYQFEIIYHIKTDHILLLLLMTVTTLINKAKAISKKLLEVFLT